MILQDMEGRVIRIHYRRRKMQKAYKRPYTETNIQKETGIPIDTE
jgi:hypothetical protein